jgi:serine/threonine protein kinase
VTLSRASLPGAAVEVLSRGGAGNPDVLHVRDEGRDYVVKDFSGRGPFMRRLAPWLVRRELRAYEQLQGHPAVPRLPFRIDDLALAVEYRPGEILGPRLAAWVPQSFIPELREAVREMHARGVVHLDLRHRSNALADPDGHPVLIDFASAVRFRPGGIAARILLPMISWIDLRAVDKWEHQLEAARSKSLDSEPRGTTRRAR